MKDCLQVTTDPDTLAALRALSDLDLGALAANAGISMAGFAEGRVMGGLGPIPTDLRHLVMQEARAVASTGEWTEACRRLADLGAKVRSVMSKGKTASLHYELKIDTSAARAALEDLAAATRKQAEQTAAPQERTITINLTGGTFIGAKGPEAVAAEISRLLQCKAPAPVPAHAMGLVAHQSKTPPFCSMERAGAIWALLRDIENTGGFPDTLEGAAAYRATIKHLANKRHEYFNESFMPGFEGQLACMGSFGVGPLARMTRDEDAISRAAAPVFNNDGGQMQALHEAAWYYLGESWTEPKAQDLICTMLREGIRTVKLAMLWLRSRD